MDAHEIGLGPFRLDLRRRRLLRAGEPVRLGSRALDILCILAGANGGLVGKDELLAQVWPGRIVEENNLQVHISALRKIIDDGKSGQSHIVTVPGRGYRLVGAEPPPGRLETAIEQRSATSTPPSIAVLPFQNMSDDPDQDYLADGIVEDLITGLSRVKWFLVIARNSAFAYKGRATDVKQIGRELGVRYVLEGGVRKAGGRIRVTTQLIETNTGVHLWAERYDRQLENIFDLQDEITMSVVGAIEPNLRKAEIQRVRRERPDSLDAYDLVLRALPSVYGMMAEGAATAVPLLDKALEAEPDYPRAHALLAWCYHFRFSRGGLREEDRKAAVHHARAAIAGGSDEAPALAIAGLVIWFDEHDAQTAMDLFDRALAISESDAFALGCSAVALAWMNRPEPAAERARRALRLSPFDSLNYMAHDALSVANFQKGLFQEAREAAARAVECNPGFSVPHLLLAAALVRLGRGAEAKAAAQCAMSLNPAFTISGYSMTVGHVPDVFAPYRRAWAEAGLPA